MSDNNSPRCASSNLMREINFHLVNKCDCSQSDVNLFLETFEVPSTGKGLWTVATRLAREILPVMLTSQEEAVRELAMRLTPIAEALEFAADKFPSFPEFRFAPPTDGSKTRRTGFLDDSPIYGVMWFGCDHQKLNTQYACLRAHFLVAYREEKTELSSRLHVLKTASRYCRLMGSTGRNAIPDKNRENPQAPHTLIPTILGRMPTAWVGRKAYGEELLELARQRRDEDRLGEEIEAIECVAEMIYGNLPDARPRVPGSKSASSGETTHAWGGYGEPLSLPREVSPGDDLEVIDFIGSGDEPRESDGTEDGIDEEDLRHVEREVKIRQGGQLLSNKDDRLLHIGNANMSLAISMSNQMFPFARCQNTVEDVSALRNQVIGPHGKSLDLGKIEVMVLIELILCTGQSFDQCHAAIHTNTFDDECLGINVGTGRYGFQAWIPNGHHGSFKVLHFPIPEPLKDAICILVGYSPIIVGHRIFSTEKTDLKRRIELELKLLQMSHGVLLTLTSINTLLYRTISQQQGGDESAAILITGQSTHRGYVPATYSNWSSGALQEIYIRGVEAIARYADIFPAFDVVKKPNVTHHGSSYVPKMGDVQTFVKAIKGNVFSTHHLPPNRPGIPETHFAYIMYVYSMLSFATGWRPSTSPLPDKRLVDPETGFCMISDKDTEDAYHTHLVWLPEVCIQQLALLDEHLELMAERLMLINADTAQIILRADSVKLTGIRIKDKSVWREDPRFLFRIRLDGGLEPLFPQQIKAFWQKHFEVKKNGHRHFARTELRKRGVPDEIVRAMLGHWRVGEESFGKFSALDPHIMRDELASVLPTFMEEMGWIPLKSPFWKQ